MLEAQQKLVDGVKIPAGHAGPHLGRLVLDWLQSAAKRRSGCRWRWAVAPILSPNQRSGDSLAGVFTASSALTGSAALWLRGARQPSTLAAGGFHRPVRVAVPPPGDDLLIRNLLR